VVPIMTTVGVKGLSIETGKKSGALALLTFREREESKEARVD